MKISWTSLAWEEYVYWQGNDKKILKRINQLIKDIQRTPLAGIGKPEPLRFGLREKWSRRIDTQHRLVYQHNTSNNEIIIFQCRYHY